MEGLQSQSVCPEIDRDILDSQDQELLSILEELQILQIELLKLRVIFVTTQYLTSAIRF